MSDQLTLNIRLRADATFETFEFAEGQADLGRALAAFARGEGQDAQWYLWGAAETGKTHLAQAVCHAAAQIGATSAYFPLRRMAAAGASCLEGMENVHLLAVDDVDAVWGDAQWALGLFALINRARERGTRLLFTASDRPPQDVLADLRSRLLWGPVYQLHRLSDEGLQGLLRRSAQARGFDLGVAESQYLLRHVARQPSALLAALDVLDRASLRAKRRLTVPFIRSVLEAGRLDPGV